MVPLLTEEESAVDPYLTLGVESGAAENEIKKAYRKLSLKYHPDKVGVVYVLHTDFTMLSGQTTRMGSRHLDPLSSLCSSR